MRAIRKWLFAGAVMLMSASAFAQGTITGTVMDGELNEPLPGANVVVKGTTNGVSTDFDGNFTIEVTQTSGILVVSYLGFTTKEVSFSGSGNVGNIVLEPNTQTLEGVVVVGTGVIDIARERETPVAVSTIRAVDIQEKIGNQEFPEILNTTPSVYATKDGGGYGDSRINVRGFDQRNTAFIINGQPVNDMENGWVYWSNWQGLSDIASGMQVQRGLGASKLAVPSVGGTVTIVTRSTENEEGGFIASTLGNDSYFKTVGAYNTGMNEKGWASSVLLGRWSGNGYVDGTEGAGFTYLLSVGYKPSDTHAFNFTFTGAGQWHHQRTTWLTIRDHFNFGGDDFRKFNADWGLKNGEEYTFRRNFYNKPIGTLNWDWNLSDKVSLSTALYGSWGRGGGTGSRGRNFGINPFRKDLTQAIEDGDLPYRNANGTINFDAIVANNKAGLPYAEENSNYQGLIIGTNTSISPNNSINESVAVRRASMNSHNWYGAISNLKFESDNWTYGVGVDLRTYKGYHYRVLNDLLGLDGYWSTGNRNLVNGIILTETIEASPFKDTGLNSDKINYYNIGEVKWAGFNGIIEYKTPNKLSTVLQAGLSSQSYKRIDYFAQPNNVESDKKTITGGYVKGGANLNIDEKSNIFFNAGFIARQPNFDAVFPNFANAVNEEVGNEKIKSLELGYGFRSSGFNLNINLYSTSWTDRFLSRGIDLGNGVDGTANFSGINQLHQGIEIEGFARITDRIRLNAMMSIGNWRYKDDVKANVFDDNQQSVGTSTLYLEDVKVGDAAQFTTYVGMKYEVFDNFNLNASWRNASNLYADFSPLDNVFLQPDNKGALKLPSYSLVDLGLGYKFMFNKSSLSTYLNVNNLFDKEYIAESNSNIHATAGSETYEGIDTMNNVWFGFGRTWNLSLRYRF